MTNKPIFHPPRRQLPGLKTVTFLFRLAFRAVIFPFRLAFRAFAYPFRKLGVDWARGLLEFGEDVVLFVRRQFESSIRLQLIATFVFCLFVAFAVGSLLNPIFVDISKVPVIDYTNGIRQIDNRARSILYALQNEWPEHPAPGVAARPTETVSREERINELIKQESSVNPSVNILVVDLDGKVLHKSPNATESEVDLHSIIRNAMEFRLNNNRYENKEYYSFYPINLDDRKAYLVVYGHPEPNILYVRKNNPISAIVGIVTFIVLFLLLTKRKMNYIEELARGLMEISKGDLNFRVRERSKDELGLLAKSINIMASELQRTIEEERNAEKTKNELITNVSHDLRTPLTLIMGYLRLLKDKNYENEQQADSYVNIAYNKSEKLKNLIDDLFEYTKLSNKGETLHLERVCLNELLEQLLEEMVSYSETNGLKIVRGLPSQKIMVRIDADKMIRVFDNLLTNAVKYSRKPGTIRVVMFEENGHALVCIANKGDPLPQRDLDRLFERFYRVDASRSSETGGSGLGLAIAKSIIDYHGGQIWAECENDDIRFWVKLALDRADVAASHRRWRPVDKILAEIRQTRGGYARFERE